MSIKLAVFDIAGTTVADDNAVGKAFQKAFLDNGFTIALSDVTPLMGYHKPLAIQMVLEKIGEEAEEETIAAIHSNFQEVMLDFYEYDPEVKALPGAVEIFQELKERGIRVALNTGFSRQIADTIVNRLQWIEKGLIDDYIASDEVKLGRPHPFMLQQLMERAGIEDANEVAKIGDTEVDVNEGRNAGCGLVVSVTTGAYTRAELEAYHPDYILDHLDQLSSLIV